MDSNLTAEITQTVLVISVGFLVWYVKIFLGAQIKTYSAELGAIQARHAQLDKLAEIETTLKTAAADVEIASARIIESDALARAKGLDFLERQLAEFYWPVYIRLQTDNEMWERLQALSATPVAVDSPDDSIERAEPIEHAVARRIERDIVLPNHAALVKIIQSKIHVAAAGEELETELLYYLKHVAAFRALRTLGIIDKDPKDIGLPWHNALFPLIRKKTRDLQRQFDEQIRRRDGSAPSLVAP